MTNNPKIHNQQSAITNSHPHINNQQSDIHNPSPSDEFYEIWKTLSDIQRRFVTALTKHPTKREAALSLGLRPDTVYHWPPAIDQALALLRADVLRAAWDELREAAARAALVKTQGLDLEDDRLRQQAATEILDRLLGRPRPQPPSPHSDDELNITVSYEE